MHPDKEKNPNKYDGFLKWEIELVQIKTRGLLKEGKLDSKNRKCRFTKDDLPDLEQELLLKVLKARETIKNYQQFTALPKTIISRILDNKIKDILNYYKSDKRYTHMVTDSLSKEIDHNEDNDDEKITFDNILAEDNKIKFTREPSDNSSYDLKIDLHIKIKKICSEHQSKIIDLLKKGHSITETARILGIKRTTLNREISRIKKLFTQHGLDKYL